MQAASPAPELVLEASGPILASTRFATSEALRSLLRYTVEKALAGLGSELKEYSIAVEAFGRPPSFDPREDNITVAILPFMNLTADDEAAYFCDGLAEELIDLLSRTNGLRVIARTSSFQFKGVPLDVRE
ncbi:MAG TPA: hypothetical protein VLY24_07405, partial [Bryobacteraceae bacterium]|nr:hypothetical protein [Bryobacteraceae bacterium]